MAEWLRGLGREWTPVTHTVPGPLVALAGALLIVPNIWGRQPQGQASPAAPRSLPTYSAGPLGTKPRGFFLCTAGPGTVPVTGVQGRGSEP